MVKRFVCVALALSGCQQPKFAATDPNANAVGAPRTEPSWSYGVEKDEMRNSRSRWAQLESSNSPQLEFPYAGGSPVTLSLWKHEGETYPDNVSPRLVLSNGQFDCSDDGKACYVDIKVDHAKPVTLYAVKDDCGSDQCLALHNDPAGPLAAKSVIAALRGSKRITIEVPLYKYGTYQYQFNTARLVWSTDTFKQ